MLKGGKISILGDSISTYQGVSNDASANSTIADNPYFYRQPFPIERTYWRILMDNLGLGLCVNNSRSGGTLSERDDPHSGVNRANHLSTDGGECPELIIVFMGINDLGRRVGVDVFAADYERALTVIRERYPDAAVCCVNIPDRDVVMRKQAELFNQAIDRAVVKAGARFFVADLFNSRLNNDFYYMNTLDGLHPDEDGMRVIASVVEEAIRSSC